VHRGNRESLFRTTKYEVALVLLFILSLPLVNPWVRGDGVGYYAFARALLIEHRLDFTKDWQRANASFRMSRIGADGQPLAKQYTRTGHLDNHFSIGPALLWSPFLIIAHAGVILCDRFGAQIPADGFSKPYLMAMALGTALYGFLALLISFSLARRFVADRWAFLATLGIWFGSSLPVYMYFNPSWSHAQSAFTVAVFAWYWTITRATRTWFQWMILGMLGGLMLDVYYLSVILLLLPLLESLGEYRESALGSRDESVGRLLSNNVIFGVAAVVAFLPTLVTKKIIYGGYLNFGYTEKWFWNSPAFLKVCFSSDHGLFTWTPIAIFSLLGLFAIRTRDRSLALYSTTVFLGYLVALGCYQDWAGISAYGNRFCVSLTVLLVLGLAGFFDGLARLWPERHSTIFACSGTVLLVVWNLGLIYQWGMHMIPERGPIRWRLAAYNQAAVVPAKIASSVGAYLTQRKSMMDQIEQTDMNQIKASHTSP
jgi:hypothetical protein